MASRFQRFLLPGFAFKAVVIGGGYATGRELAEYFLPSGPHGAIAGMLLAMVLWSLICAATFLFARRFRAFDYVSFVQALLGRAWIAFELAYLMFVILILAVFGAAAGALGEAVVGVPRFVGTLALMIAIALVVAFGNTSVERLFKYVSFLLYGVYIAFAVLAFAHFGDRIAATAAFHPGGLVTDQPDSPHGRVRAIKSRVYLGPAIGDLPPDAEATLRAKLDAAHVRYQIEHYDANHGYAVDDSEAYNEAAAEKHYAALDALFAAALRN